MLVVKLDAIKFSVLWVSVFAVDKVILADSLFNYFH